MIATPQGTAGKKKMEGGGRERDRNEWEGAEGREAELEDEEKIGKGGKMGVRTEGVGEKVEGRADGRGRREDWKR